MVDQEPRQIGPYEVLARLAVGGVGAVYLARKRGPANFQRIVAVKRLHSQYVDEPDFVTMFMDEGRLAARIHHANVVSVIEVGADADGHYVVMDYVEGSNLAHFHWHAVRLHQTMPRSVAIRIVLDALAGLDAAHELEADDGTRVNLVHRDVSPQNILVGTDGTSRLGDFGIARAQILRGFETVGPGLKGKLEYMAPEQIESKPVDRRTDIFAMGIVLWELLTGRRLFTAENQVGTLQRLLFTPIPSPRSQNASVSAELDRICMRALERPLDNRYPTAGAFADDLALAARGDAGIATQREVSQCLNEVLGEAMPRLKRTLQELTRGSRRSTAAVPDLAPEMQGPGTDQLPASDPMIPVGAAAAHPSIHQSVNDKNAETLPGAKSESEEEEDEFPEGEDLIENKTLPFPRMQSYPDYPAPSGSPSTSTLVVPTPASVQASSRPRSVPAPPRAATPPARAPRRSVVAIVAVLALVAVGVTAAGVAIRHASNRPSHVAP